MSILILKLGSQSPKKNTIHCLSMKKPNKDLFHLIQSLDKNERRYFKLFVQNSTPKEKQYLTLFDAISRQKEYDEAKLRNKLKAPTYRKNFSRAKAYLHDLILKAMRNYYTNQSIEDQILDGLRNIKFFLKKGLLQLLEKEANRIEKLAMDYDKFYYIPRITSWKLMALASQPTHVRFMNQIEAEVEAWFDNIDYIKQCVQNYGNTYKDVLGWYKHKKHPDVNLDLIHDSPRLSLNIAHQHYLSNVASLNINTNADLLRANKAIRAQLTSQPHYLKDSDLFSTYVATLSMALQAISTHHPYPLVQEFEIAVQELEQLPLYKIPLDLRINMMHFKLVFYRNAGLPEKGLALKAEFDALIQKKVELLNYYFSILMYQEFAVCSFLTGDFEQASAYIEHSLFNSDIKRNSPSIYYSLRLVDLLIFYAQKEFLVLPNLLQSYRRKISKEPQEYPVAMLFLKLLQQLMNQEINPEGKRKALLEAQSALADLDQQNHYEAFKYFPYLEWIDSELEGVSIGILLQRRSGLL